MHEVDTKVGAVLLAGVRMAVIATQSRGAETRRAVCACAQGGMCWKEGSQTANEQCRTSPTTETGEQP